MARKTAEKTKVVEEEEVAVVFPKRYYVKFWKRMEPSDPRFDLEIGTIYWSDVKEDILIEGLHNRYGPAVENLLANDLQLSEPSIDYGLYISRHNTPKAWVQHLHKAMFPDDLYATQFTEGLDETE